MHSTAHLMGMKNMPSCGSSAQVSCQIAVGAGLGYVGRLLEPERRLPLSYTALRNCFIGSLQL